MKTFILAVSAAAIALSTPAMAAVSFETAFSDPQLITDLRYAVNCAQAGVDVPGDYEDLIVNVSNQLVGASETAMRIDAADAAFKAMPDDARIRICAAEKIKMDDLTKQGWK